MTSQSVRCASVRSPALSAGSPPDQRIVSPIDLPGMQLAGAVAEFGRRPRQGNREAVEDERNSTEMPGKYDQLDRAVVAEQVPRQRERLVADRSGAQQFGDEPVGSVLGSIPELGPAPGLNGRDRLLRDAQPGGHLGVHEPFEIAVPVLCHSQDAQLKHARGEPGRAAEPGSELGDQDAKPRTAQQDVVEPD